MLHIIGNRIHSGNAGQYNCGNDIKYQITKMKSIEHSWREKYLMNLIPTHKVLSNEAQVWTWPGGSEGQGAWAPQEKFDDHSAILKVGGENIPQGWSLIPTAHHGAHNPPAYI